MLLVISCWEGGLIFWRWAVSVSVCVCTCVCSADVPALIQHSLSAAPGCRVVLSPVKCCFRAEHARGLMTSRQKNFLLSQFPLLLPMVEDGKEKKKTNQQNSLYQQNSCSLSRDARIQGLAQIWLELRSPGRSGCSEPGLSSPRGTEEIQGMPCGSLNPMAVLSLLQSGERQLKQKGWAQQGTCHEEQCCP